MSATENLISCVESRPCIWDITTDDYHDKKKKDLAWLEIFKMLIPNWKTLSREEKKLKGLELKRKWSNCRDYYKKNKQKLKSCPTGSAVKKGKIYIFADILSFLDKVMTWRNHDVNFDVDDDDKLIKDTEISENGEDKHEGQRDTRKQRALENRDTKIYYQRKIKEESEPKKKRTQDVSEEILNILKNKKVTSTTDYDDDEKYLLSFCSDMKKMTHLQKIDFKLGMMQLLKDIFRESIANSSSPNNIHLSTLNPGSSYTSIYHNSRSSSAQSRYSTSSDCDHLA